MIRPDMIPDEVVEAMYEADHGSTTYAELLATALSAWPGMMFNDEEVIDGDVYPAIIYLVIRKKTRDE